jgi:polar amino acid transport system substrate-binding protein
VTRRSTLSLFAVLPAIAIFAAGCGEDSGGTNAGDSGGTTAEGGVQLVNDGALTNCTGLPYRPFEYEEGGEVIGFDIDLVDLVAKELGVEQEVIDTPFDGIQSGADFNTGKCDLSSAGMTITDERKQNIDFSDPYFDATQALVAKSGSGVTDLASLDGKRLGVQNSTTGQTYAQENAPGVELVVYEDLGLLLTAVETGQVDAGINDNGVLYDWVKEKTDFEVTTEFDTGEQYGIGTRKGNTALLDVVNRVLADARSSGEYDTIYEKWFGTQPDAN